MKWKDDPPRDAWPKLRAIAEAAAATAPDNVAIWAGFAQSALTYGTEREAIGALLDAVSRTPGSARLHVAVARVLFALERFDDARTHLDQALRIDPDDRGARLLDFGMLVKAARWADAAQRIDAVRAINRLQPQLLEVCWRAAADDNDLSDMLALCEAILEEQPGHANAGYYRALVLARLARDAEARQAMATDRIVEITDLPPPAGFVDGDAFRAALRGEILGNPTLIANPRGKAARNGVRTRRLRQPGAHAVEALIGQIRSAVADYAEKHSARSETFARSRPALARLDIWATILGADGFQMSHRHVNGWLSGVYYVCAPRQAGESSYRGPLLFGALDAKRDKIDPPWEVRRIEPVPGRLVLFPSSAPHATEPTGLEGDRISIAFDVIAA